MREGFDEHPINPLPPVVWLLALPILAGELAFGLGQAGFAGELARGWRLDALQRFAFAPDIFRAMIDQGIWPVNHLARILAYSFVHASLTHALMVLVFILALGKMVGELFSLPAVLAVFFGGAVAGAVAYALVPGMTAPIYGGYPAVYGLVGAFTWILWTRLGQSHDNRARAFTLIGFLLGIQLIFGLLFGTSPDWIAELVGFATGFGLSFLVAPGGWRRALQRLRQR
ncbi:rhomboid family intramembrane serine protease [Pontitalea aquivivens]|uniref:rhomboid family intramembrane serine protease n=1 Tax=Pontitalea aquivivens TaxID=3388663 RepID=UPI003970FE71